MSEDMDLDLFMPDQFQRAIKQKFGRRFTFGPIEFEGLNTNSLNPAEARQLVINNLEQTEHLQAPGSSIFVHGYRVAVKERTLKRGSSLLKHARFL